MKINLNTINSGTALQYNFEVVEYFPFSAALYFLSTTIIWSISL